MNLPISTQAVDHYSLIVADTQRAVDFYLKLFDWQVIARPDLGFAGAWIQTSHFNIHLLEVPSPCSKVRPEHGGRDYHLALQVSDLTQVMSKLDAEGVSYTLSRSGRRALFFKDLDQNAWELVENA